jgi:hypothetical protein
MIKNSTKFDANTIGFYEIKGNSTKDFIQNSEAASIAHFLENINSENTDYKATIIVIETVASHRSRFIRDKARELGLYLVYLLPYSPLNSSGDTSKESYPSHCQRFARYKSIISESWDKFPTSKI